MAFFSIIPETNDTVLDNEGEGRKPSFLFEVAEAIFAKVTTLPFRRRATQVLTSSLHLAIAIVHNTDVMCDMVFKGAKLLKNSRAVTKDNWSNVSGYITGARAMLQRTMAELWEFAKGCRTPDKVALWTNSAAKKVMEVLAVRDEEVKTQKALAKMATNLARARRGQDDDNPWAPKAPRQPPPTFTPADCNGNIICFLPNK